MSPSSRIGLDAWDSLPWRRIKSIRRDGKIVAVRILVYAEDNEEYVSFLTPEAYFELEK